VSRNFGGGLSSLLFFSGVKITELLFLVQDADDGLPPLALGAEEVKGRLVPVLHDQVAVGDDARAAAVEVNGRGLLRVVAVTKFLFFFCETDVRTEEARNSKSSAQP